MGARLELTVLSDFCGLRHGGKGPNTRPEETLRRCWHCLFP
jgi:hypothetical protein